MSYLSFVEQPNPGKLTKVWHIYSAVQAGPQPHPLGVIHYRPGWRKYVFWPGDAVFDVGCLTEIVNFLTQHKDDRQ
jgi:hypothetical protein